MTKIEYAKAIYDSGCCPGCGTPLEQVAGKGARHYPDGHTVSSSNNFTGPGLCPWSADDLTSIVLIGSGTVTRS